MNSDIFRGTGIRIDIKAPDNFLKIKETLTRIGIPSKHDNKLYQSCHILHKRDSTGVSHYAIEHFKEMFILDGKTSDITMSDYARRNYIAQLLEKYGLCSLENKLDDLDTNSVNDSIKIVPYKEKNTWELISKYNIGK